MHDERDEFLRWEIAVMVALVLALIAAMTFWGCGVTVISRPQPVPVPAPQPGPPPAPTPDPIPTYTRDQVCRVRTSFQGLTVHTSQYGDLPWFEPAISSLSPEDREAVYAAKHAAGDTHLGIAVSWRYAEAHQAYEHVPGRDLSNDLPTLRALVEDAIRHGFIVTLHLAGDGQSTASGYNDPVGWTYGHQWLMAHLAEIIAAMDGVNDAILYVPGYDGVFYGWTPDQVIAFGQKFRQLLPNGYLAIEHNIGHIPVGNGAGDWAGPLQTYDVVLSEFDWPLHKDSTWQIAGRLLGPTYHRPSDQPAGDDPTPPWYLKAGTPRGKYYAIAYEYGEYQWVRGQASAADLKRAADYLRAMGYE